MIDLHVHTTASDGQYTPSQIIEFAHDKNIGVIAITDHDTVAGIDEGRKAAKKLGVTFVPGTELNISFPTGEFHLLGLGFKQISPSLTILLDNLVKNRELRNVQIIEKMREGGVDITLEEMQADFPDLCLDALILQQNL